MSVIAVRNPGTGELLGEVPARTPEHVAAVVDAAQQGQRAMAATLEVYASWPPGAAVPRGRRGAAVTGWTRG